MSPLARIVLGALAACATVSAGILKEETVECVFSPCVRSYESDDGDQCRNTFRTSHIMLNPPYFRRLYCSKPCTRDEAISCYAEQCRIAEKDCNNGPASPICKDAMEKCFKPIKMDKEICTERFMELPVAYDDATGTCSYLEGVKPAFDKNTDDATFKIDYFDLQEEIVYSCLGMENPTHLASIAFYINCKQAGNKGVAFQCIQHSKKGLKPAIADKRFKMSCEKAKPVPGRKTELVKRVLPYGKK